MESKKIKIASPYFYEGQINFKYKPFHSWTQLYGYESTLNHHLPKTLHSIGYNICFPNIKSLVSWSMDFLGISSTSILCFVQPYSLRFDTFPYYTCCEIIPFFWDCWPDNFEIVFKWIEKYNVKTAFFTSSQFTKIIKEKYPYVNALYVPEGIDVESYKKGDDLKNRSIDFLEFGRRIDNIVNYKTVGINYVKGWIGNKVAFSQDQLIDNLSNAKVVAAYPKSWTNPEKAGGIETLTQRYWECMLSRCVMIGHAPEELIDLIGYNPVIELDKNDPDKQLRNILINIDKYQALVDKNYQIAVKHGDWKSRMMKVHDFLLECGYEL